MKKNFSSSEPQKLFSQGTFLCPCPSLEVFRDTRHDIFTTDMLYTCTHTLLLLHCYYTGTIHVLSRLSAFSVVIVVCIAIFAYCGEKKKIFIALFFSKKLHSVTEA